MPCSRTSWQRGGVAAPSIARRDLAPDARALVTIALILGALVSAAFVLFIGGEMLSDPGGWQGVGWLAAWLVPSLGLAVFALLAPRIAYPVLVIAVGVVIAAAFGSMYAADAVWAFEDAHGPVNLIVEIGLLMPLVALGRAMPRQAGWLLVLAIAAPLACQAIALLIVGQWSVIIVLAIVALPYAIVALLLILGGRASSVGVSGGPAAQQAP